MATNGLVLIKPTSTAKTGGSSTATIEPNGSVSFALCETLSLNGVFSSEYDNYMIVLRHVHSATYISIDIRVRAAGTDATGSNYVRQFLDADNTSVTGARATSGSANFITTSPSNRSGSTSYIYGPHLAQPTAFRSVNVGGQSGAALTDYAATHSLSTSYDGFTLLVTSGTFSGLVKVYGLVQ
jgi:hypothetical protein